MKLLSLLVIVFIVGGLIATPWASDAPPAPSVAPAIAQTEPPTSASAPAARRAEPRVARELGDMERDSLLGLTLLLSLQRSAQGR